MFVEAFSPRDFRMFSFFFCVSFLMWYSLASRKTYVSTITMPISYVNMPNDCVFSENVPSEVSIMLEDKGSSLLYYRFFGRNGKSVEVDLLSSGEDRVISSGFLKSAIQKNLSSSARISGFRPDQIDIKFSILEKKEVPVVYSGHYSADRQYYIFDSLRVVPSSVTIYAPRQVLDTINVANLEMIDLSDVRDTVRRSVPFMKIKNVKFSQPTAEVIVVSQKFTEKIVEVPIKVSHKPDDVAVRLFPSSVKIEALVGIDSYDALDASSFVAMVDYNEVSNGQKYLELRVDSLPAGVFHIKLNEKNIEYLIEKN